MAAYNPNGIWKGKEKEPAYIPPGDPTSYTGSQNSAPSTSPEDRTPTKNTTDDKPRNTDFFKRHGLLLFAVGIVLLIFLAALVYYLLLPPATPNVTITFSEPSSTTIGQPFPLTITVSNESKSVIQNADINISLPNGFSFVGQSSATIPIGTLSSQTINPPQTVQVVAAPIVGGTSQTIGAQLTYSTAATPNATYTSSAATTLTISSQSALSLSYNAPSSIFSGQNFDIAVNYQNNTGQALDGVQLSMQYPPAYEFVTSTTIAPTGAADDVWNIGTLAPNATGTLTIIGNIVGPASAQYQLTGTIGATFAGQNYPATAAPVSFVVTPSPLSLTVALNHSQNYIAGLSDNLNYTLTYTNNSDVTFKSVNIAATLTGTMYDLPSLKTSGSFNSQSNTITWYAANTPPLASIAPGQSGTVTFTISTKGAFPIQLPSDKDYTLNVTAQATSPTVPPNTAGTNTTSITALTSKVGGEISIISNGFYKEASTTIVNTGPYPPVLNQPTQYTIHWTITDYSTDMQNVTVSAYLQSGSIFTGVATSTGLASTSLPVYNPGTGQITWTVPYIPATTGVISPPVQTVFQISNTPAINEVGQSVTLLGPATLVATDAYTSSTVTTQTASVTTRLPDDPYANGQTGVVAQ